jgi:SAM-dependent methyltransferase
VNTSASRPDWRLPRGVTRGLWEHAQAEHVIGAHVERFSQGGARELDELLLNDLLQPPGLVVDLGCGDGRLAMPLARRGFHCIAVDLSRPALASLRRQAEAESLPIEPLAANLVELDCLVDRSADHCISMYSTLGMIRGRDNRLQFLRHARRILKPGGMLVVHVHNRWYNLFQPQSRLWFIANLFESAWRRDVEAGDKFFAYQGVPNFFLHVFTRREFLGDLRSAGFRVERLIPLSIERRDTLRRPWLFGRFRAGGWIAVCR